MCKRLLHAFAGYAIVGAIACAIIAAFPELSSLHATAVIFIVLIGLVIFNTWRRREQQE